MKTKQTAKRSKTKTKQNKPKTAKFRQHVLAESVPHLSWAVQWGQASLCHGLLPDCSFPGPVKSLVLAWQIDQCWKYSLTSGEVMAPDRGDTQPTEYGFREFVFKKTHQSTLYSSPGLLTNRNEPACLWYLGVFPFPVWNAFSLPLCLFKTASPLGSPSWAPQSTPFLLSLKTASQSM